MSHLIQKVFIILVVAIQNIGKIVFVTHNWATHSTLNFL